MSEAGVKARLIGVWDRVTSRIHTNGNGAVHDGQGAAKLPMSKRLQRLWGQVRHGAPVGDTDAYRRLTLQLHHTLRRGEAPRSVLVTTPARSDASASASMQLARCMAEELGRPVLLVDASDELDLTRLLDGAPPQGLTDLIANPHLRLEDLVVPTSHERVSFLPRGTRHHAPSMTTHEAARVVGGIGERFDFMVVSAGGLLSNGLALWLAGYVGQVLLLVTEGRTHKSEIDAAQSTLRLCKADNVTTVLTERSSGAAP